ncbi:hypothetical protein GCM10017044_15380 [Kordiimonas sediminis]|uniref:Uncharacterized protein n=1 Tax=Kordiimonas sediminis TaxID=1735581 RepID=A0A919ASQ8_9PROT|nr:hypothetical protein [Kordiimonas sediminis]GHF22187.1 hypothetical protein GCM10017044_15380 [Kordiimonas sediminis]
MQEKSPYRRFLVWTALAPFFGYVWMLGLAYWNGGQVEVLGITFESQLSSREITIVVISIPVFFVGWINSLVACLKAGPLKDKINTHE